jgi:hypothetical protein
MYGENACAAKNPIAPAELLNNIASDVIASLDSAIGLANIIQDRMFVTEVAKSATVQDPYNLETRLQLIRAMSQELNGKLATIQSRV